MTTPKVSHTRRISVPLVPRKRETKASRMFVLRVCGLFMASISFMDCGTSQRIGNLGRPDTFSDGHSSADHVTQRRSP